MKKLIFALSIFLFCLNPLITLAEAPKTPPFKYSRSTPTKLGTSYFNSKGKVVGRSYSTKNGTYWQTPKSSYRSHTTRSGNTYFHRTR